MYRLGNIIRQLSNWTLQSRETNFCSAILQIYLPHSFQACCPGLHGKYVVEVNVVIITGGKMFVLTKQLSMGSLF